MRSPDTSPGPAQTSSASLCDLLDRVLDRGIVLEGDIVISVAGVDLIYLRLEALLSSVATAIEAGAFPAAKMLPEAVASPAEETLLAPQK
ncbi:MAG: gas vesicle protein [Acidobacteriota bacterium]